MLHSLSHVWASGPLGLATGRRPTPFHCVPCSGPTLCCSLVLWHTGVFEIHYDLWTRLPILSLRTEPATAEAGPGTTFCLQHPPQDSPHLVTCVSGLVSFLCQDPAAAAHTAPSIHPALPCSWHRSHVSIPGNLPRPPPIAPPLLHFPFKTCTPSQSFSPLPPASPAGGKARGAGPSYLRAQDTSGTQQCSHVFCSVCVCVCGEEWLGH